MALDRNERIGFWRGIALNHISLAESYWHLSNFEKALFHAEQAHKNLQHIPPSDRKVALMGFSKVLLDLGKYMQNLGELMEARAYAKLAMGLAEEAKASEILQAATYLLRHVEQHTDEERAI